MVTRKQVNRKKVASVQWVLDWWEKDSLVHLCLQLYCFPEKKVYRLVDTHEKYTMHPFRPRKVPQERRQLQGLLQF